MSYDNNISFYHGRLSREAAEHLLKGKAILDCIMRYNYKLYNISIEIQFTALLLVLRYFNLSHSLFPLAMQTRM